jgi:hypothetical protein
MTEEQLLEFGFERIDILDDDSQNGFDYYYYHKDLCSGVSLHSTDSIDVKDDDWSLKSFDIPALNIKETMHYHQFLEIMNNITC